MHRYLRAIGFGDPMNHKELEELCQLVQTQYEENCIWARGDEAMFGEMQKDVGLHMGRVQRGRQFSSGILFSIF